LCWEKAANLPTVARKTPDQACSDSRIKRYSSVMQVKN
jgi:hypothetical protein